MSKELTAGCRRFNIFYLLFIASLLSVFLCSTLYAQENESISLHFDDADIYETAHTIFGDILKVNYLIDPKINGRITFKTSRPINKRDILPVISTIFRINGVSIIKENDLYRLIPLKNITREPATIDFGNSSDDIKIKGESMMQIVPLNFVHAKDMLEILKPFISEGAVIAEVPHKNCLIIADTDENMSRLLKVVEIFDDNIFSDMEVEMFVFENLSVKDVVDELQGSFPLFSVSSKESLKVRFVPVESLNALLVIAPSKEHLTHIKKWVDIIDSAFEGAKPKIYVYPLQNSKADHVAEIVNMILPTGSGGSTQRAKSTDKSKSEKKTVTNPFQKAAQLQQRAGAGSGGDSFSASSFVSPGTRILYDDITNSLIILALPKDYKFIEDLIRKIDSVPRQVLIEVLVAEVGLTDQLEFGIEWFLNSKFNFDNTPLYGTTVVGESSSALYSSADITNPLTSSGFSFAAVDSAGMVRGLLQTLAIDSKLKIIASPHVMVSDNRQARIQVGDQVPVETGNSVASNGSAVTTIQYRDTGAVLEVTPHINEGGLVSLEVKQEFSLISNDKGVQNNPIFSNRSAETNLVVQDGQTVVIGGLIWETSNSSHNGVPLLKDIPILGYLFGATSKTTDRTELIILITPHVVTDINGSEKVSNEFLDKLTNIKKSELLNDVNPDSASGHQKRENTDYTDYTD